MAGRHPNHYWKSLQERDALVKSLAGGEEQFSELLEFAPGQIARREFLKASGFTFLGAVLTGCQRAPVEKAIPYLVKPEEIIPGSAYFYASTCGGCSAGCGLLVKNRAGAPLKLEGKPGPPLSK